MYFVEFQYHFYPNTYHIHEFKYLLPKFFRYA